MGKPRIIARYLRDAGRFCWRVLTVVRQDRGGVLTCGIAGDDHAGNRADNLPANDGFNRRHFGNLIASVNTFPLG